MSRKRAFTLVELLVVIGIIALLVSVLLPALSKAREQAVRISCASNQRQFLLALTTYANQYRTYPYQRYSSSWATHLSPDQYTNQYEADGFIGVSPPPGTFSTVAQAVDGVCGWPVVYQMMQIGIIKNYKGMACTSPYGPFGTHSQRGWYRNTNVSTFTMLPDGKNPQDVAFYHYIGPGLSGAVAWTYASPLPMYNSTTYYDSVRPGYAYKNGVLGAKEKGVFKLTSCPNYWGVDPGPIFWFMSPHEPVLLSQGNTFPNFRHFRNYGFNDGHVEGYTSQYGYR